MDDKEDFWKDAEVISRYTRAQALEDGVLADISKLACEAGFKYPVVVTSGVWAILEPSEELKAQGQSYEGRAWDLLNVLRWAIRGGDGGDTVEFSPLFVTRPGGEAAPVNLRSVCGPGDDGVEPVITVLLANED